VFLAPTHALVEQPTDDLQAPFPSDRFGLAVSGDSDSLLLGDAQLEDIEGMTPERCLAMLSFVLETFAQVGLLVFDGCHLLSPSRRIGRALDIMLCVLAFNAAAPDADFLMLSAMLKNGDDLAAWVADLTDRPCESVELLWKPSRQARGVVVYHQGKIEPIEASALRVQRDLNRRAGKPSNVLRAAAERELDARLWVLWVVQHNWTQVEEGYTYTRVTRRCPCPDWPHSPRWDQSTTQC
jgi:replicative superfamily II helicase